MAYGHYLGLFVAPEEAMMREVGRIFYVHVPTALMALLMYLVAFILAIGSLWTGGRKWDAYLGHIGSWCASKHPAHGSREYLGQNQRGVSGGRDPRLTTMLLWCSLHRSVAIAKCDDQSNVAQQLPQQVQ